MADKIKLELVTPYRKVLSEEVDEVTAAGALGEFGVLPGHAPFLTSLKPGELTYKKGGAAQSLVVSQGYFEIENDLVTVLVESAERAEDIDVARARTALARAEEAMKNLAADSREFQVEEAALQRAEARIQVATKGSAKH